MALDKLTKAKNMMRRYGYKLHHTASQRGYCAAGEAGNKERYNGRFGRGWIVILGKYRESNQYTEIGYYVK